MKETTALKLEKPARQRNNFASMEDNVSRGRLAIHAYVLSNIQDSFVSWSLKFLFYTRRHLLVHNMTAIMEFAWPRRVKTMVTLASAIQDIQVRKSVSSLKTL